MDANFVYTYSHLVYNLHCTLSADCNLHVQSIFYESIDRKKNHPLVAYHYQHSGGRIYLWSPQYHSTSCFHLKMGVVSIGCIVRDLDVERPPGQENVQKKDCQATGDQPNK